MRCAKLGEITDTMPTASAATDPLIDRVTLAVPALAQRLEGVTILHVSDLYCRGPRRRFDALLEAVYQNPVDLLLLTGDYMARSGDEPAAHELLSKLVTAAGALHGAVGVFGERDTAELRRRLAHLPVHWLANAAWASPAMPVTVYGIDCRPGERPEARRTVGDLPAALIDEPADLYRPRLRILLAHQPTWMSAAADAGIDLFFAGHTRGGQWRWPFSADRIRRRPAMLPTRRTAGILRDRGTLGVITRGLGEPALPRFACPPHAPLITLTYAPQPHLHTQRPVIVTAW